MHSTRFDLAENMSYSKIARELCSESTSSIVVILIRRLVVVVIV